jgi:hypothetical protein
MRLQTINGLSSSVIGPCSRRARGQRLLAWSCSRLASGESSGLVSAGAPNTVRPLPGQTVFVEEHPYLEPTEDITHPCWRALEPIPRTVAVWRASAIPGFTLITDGCNLRQAIEPDSPACRRPSQRCSGQAVSAICVSQPLGEPAHRGGERAGPGRVIPRFPGNCNGRIIFLLRDR